MRSCARICRCTKAGLVEYLSHVMIGIVTAGIRKPEFYLLKLGDDDNGQDGSADGYSAVTVDDERAAICTSVLEDKTIAMFLLARFIAELGEESDNYFEKVAQLITPILQFFSHDGC